MREAIKSGNEQTLLNALLNPSYWYPTDRRGARVNIPQAAERLALTEFNTWYVRGLAKRLMDEGVTQCQVYRAAPPRRGEPGACSIHEEQIFPVELIYKGHRAKYWPEPGNPAAIAIPSGPGCHHTIRRVA